MAQQEVRPQKNYPNWLWLVLGIFVIAFLLSLFFIPGRLRDVVSLSAPTDTPVFPAGHTYVAYGWNSVIFTVPEISYDEVTDKEIQIRGNNEYTIYSIDELAMFDPNKSTIRNQAKPKLKQVVESAAKRFEGREIRIFVHADSMNSPISNKQLAEKRADSIRHWLIKEGGVDSNRISVHPVKDEQQPVPDKATGAEKQAKQIKIVIRRHKD